MYLLPHLSVCGRVTAPPPPRFSFSLCSSWAWGVCLVPRQRAPACTGHPGRQGQRQWELTCVSVQPHGLQLMLLSSSLFLVSPTLHSSAFPDCLPHVFPLPYRSVCNQRYRITVYVYTINTTHTQRGFCFSDCTLTDIIKQIYSLRQWFLRFKNQCLIWISTNISPLLSHPTSYDRPFFKEACSIG